MNCKLYMKGKLKVKLTLLNSDINNLSLVKKLKTNNRFFLTLDVDQFVFGNYFLICRSKKNIKFCNDLKVLKEKKSLTKKV